MDKIIKSFIAEEKQLHGLKPEVNKTEIAMVMGAYNVVKDHYPEKTHVNIVRICCESMVEAEKQNISSKMSFMAGIVEKELFSSSYEAMMQEEAGLRR